jgi:hypothetical protein
MDGGQTSTVDDWARAPASHQLQPALARERKNPMGNVESRCLCTVNPIEGLTVVCRALFL